MLLSIGSGLFAPDPAAIFLAAGEAGVAIAALAGFFLLRAGEVTQPEPLMCGILVAGAADAAFHLAISPLNHQPAGFVLLALVSALVFTKPMWFGASLGMIGITWAASLRHLAGSYLETTSFLVATLIIGVGIFRIRRTASRRALDLITSEADARTELARANEDLKAFSAMASHDLKAPLRAITQLTAILQEDSPEIPSDTKENLSRIHRESKNASRLVEDLLLFSRTADAQITRSDIDTSALVRSILEDLHNTDPKRELTTMIAPDARANADPALIRAAFQNLLDNAWKYTRETPNAQITYETRRAGSKIIHTIRDNGPGFDPTRAHELFHPFVRLHSTDHEGTGLGLATVRRIIEGHGGHVWAESEPGKGSAFHMALPDATPREP